MPAESKISRLAAETIISHKMIKKNEKILVAFSGGKDSYAMLSILFRLQKKSPVKFRLLPVIIDPGFGADYAKAAEYIRKIGLDCIIRKENIASIVKGKFTSEDTGKYCFLCSRLRRGLLYSIAREQGCSKIDLGHNLDDAIETFFLNILYSSRTDTMRPIYLAEDGKTTIIRPLINVPEKLIVQYAKEKRFPLVKQDCLYKKTDSRRAQIKAMITKLSSNNPYLYPSLANVLEKLGKKQKLF